MMFTFFRWLFILPLILTAVAFGMSHQESISFTYSPYHDALLLPLYVLGLGLFAAGLIVGMVTLWVAQSRERSEKRQLKKQINTLEQDVKTLRAANENITRKNEREDDKPLAQNLLRH